MSLFGYRRGEVRKYNEKRSCGLWLIIIGIVIIAASMLGGEQKVSLPIFVVGYAIGFYIAIINKKIAKRLSWGKSSAFQNRVANLSIALLFVLMFLIAGPFFASQDWRMIWLGAFLATGLHFFPFYFVHGKSMIPLAVLCSANAVIGMILPTLPFLALALIDGGIKVAFGIYLLFLSHQTKS